MIRALLLVMLLLAPVPAVAQEPSGPILRMALDKETAIPGQPLVLRVTVLAPTWLPEPPEFPSFEAPNVIVRLPPRASGPTSERVQGETWSGVTRAYRLYPMTVGRFRITPQTVRVTFADPETREPLSVELRTEVVAFEGVAPEGAEDLKPFIAAEALTLEQTVEGEPEDLEPGGAVTRTVTARVTGLSPIFLPPLIAPLKALGISAYPKEPVVTEKQDRGAISGKRVESVTYVAQAGGRHDAGAIRLRWFNLKKNKVERAELAGFEIVSSGPAPAPPTSVGWRAVVPWMVAGALAVAFMGVVGLRLWPRVSAWRRKRRDAYHASEAFAFAQAMAALRARDFGGTIRAVDLWSSRLPSRSGKDDARLSDALARLGAALYGDSIEAPSLGPWSEAVTALRDARQKRLAAFAADRTRRRLSPLNPRVVS